MTAEMILLYGVVAKAGIDLLQLGLIGWGLRRWGKDIEKQRRRNEAWRAEWAEISQGLKAGGRRLDATHRMLGEALAKSRAQRAQPRPTP